MEAYREEHGLNKTEALRELLDSGLDAELNPDDEEPGEIELGPLTNSEQWFKEKFENSLGLMLLSAPVTLAIWLGIVLATEIWGIQTATWLPGQVLALLAVLGLIVFVASSIGALATYSALKLGIPRIIEQRNSPAEARNTAE